MPDDDDDDVRSAVESSAMLLTEIHYKYSTLLLIEFHYIHTCCAEGIRNRDRYAPSIIPNVYIAAKGQ